MRAIILLSMLFFLSIGLAYAGVPPEPLSVSLDLPKYVEPNGYTYFRSYVSGGTPPYSYVWSIISGADKGVISRYDDNNTIAIFKAESKKVGDVVIRLTVTDSTGSEYGGPYVDYADTTAHIVDETPPTFSEVHNITELKNNYRMEKVCAEQNSNERKYVAWSEIEGSGWRGFTTYWDDSDWHQQQMMYSGSANTFSCDLEMNPNSGLVMGLNNYYPWNEVIRCVHDGTSWSYEDMVKDGLAEGCWADFAFLSDNLGYAVVQPYGSTDLELYKFDWGVWSQVGSGLSPSYDVADPEVVVDCAGNAWMAWVGKSGTVRQVFLRKYTYSTGSLSDNCWLNFLGVPHNISLLSHSKGREIWLAADGYDIATIKYMWDEDPQSGSWEYRVSDDASVEYYPCFTNGLHDEELFLMWNKFDVLRIVKWNPNDETWEPCNGQMCLDPPTIGVGNIKCPAASASIVPEGVIAWYNGSYGNYNQVVCKLHEASIQVEYTSARNVFSLNISIADPDNAQMYIAGDVVDDEQTFQWINYQSTVYNLMVNGPGALNTIKVKFKDQYGNESPFYEVKVELLLVPRPQEVDFEGRPDLPFYDENPPTTAHNIYIYYEGTEEESSEDYVAASQLWDDMKELYGQEVYGINKVFNEYARSNIVFINPSQSPQPEYAQIALDNLSEEMEDFDQYSQGLFQWQQDEMYILCSYYAHSDDPPYDSIDYAIVGSTPKARFYGAQTLRQLINQNTNGDVEGAYILDWPYTKIRAQHVIAYSGHETPSYDSPWFEELGNVWHLREDQQDHNKDAKKRLKYFANLKMNAVIVAGPLHHLLIGTDTGSRPDHKWSYSKSTETWSDGRGESDWVALQELYDECRKLFMEPIPALGGWGPVMTCMPYEPYETEPPLRNNVYNSALGEGTHCYRIPFACVGETDEPLEPVYPLPVPVPVVDEYQDPILKNGDFSALQWSEGIIPGWSVVGQPRTDLQTSMDGIASCLLDPGTEISQAVSCSPYSEMRLKFSAHIWDSELEDDSGIVIGAKIDSTVVASNNKWYFYEYSASDYWRDYTCTNSGGDVFYTGNAGTVLLYADNNSQYSINLDGFHLQYANLVRNPRFDVTSGLAAWTVINGGVEHDSTNECVHIYRTTAGVSGIAQGVDAEKDTEYIIKCRAKYNMSEESKAYMKILPGEAPGNYIYSRELGYGTSDWCEMHINHKTSSEGIFQIALEIDGPGEAWFDDVEIVAKNMEVDVENGNFETLPSLDHNIAEWETDVGTTCFYTTDSSIYKRGCVKIKRTGSGTSRIYQEVTPTPIPYAEYMIRGHIKLPTEDYVDATARLKVELGDGVEPEPDETITGDHETNEPSEKWLRSDIPVIDVGDYSKMKVCCELQGTGEAKFDAIYLCRTNFVLNSSFKHTSGNAAVEWLPVNGQWGSEEAITWMSSGGPDQVSGDDPCVRLSGSTGVGIEQANISVTPYGEYMLTASVKQSAAGIANIGLKDQSGTDIGHYKDYNSNPVNQWYTLKKYYHLGDVSSIKVFAELNSSGTCFFDNIRLQRRSYVLNGGFEYVHSVQGVDRVKGWRQGSLGVPEANAEDRLEDNPPSGRSGKALIFTPEKSTYIFQEVPFQDEPIECLPWQTLRASVWIYMQPDANGYNGTPRISICLKDDFGNDFNWINLSEDQLRGYHNHYSTGEWYEQSLVFNTGRYRNMVVYLFGGYPDEEKKGITYFDDCRLEVGLTSSDVKRVFDPHGILREEPVIVESEDGSTVYALGTDFELTKDGQWDETNPFNCSYLIRRKLPGSDLEPGKTYLVSWNKASFGKTYCMSDPVVQSFLKALIDTVKLHVGEDTNDDGIRDHLNFIHTDRDEIGPFCSDGRSIALGQTPGELLHDDLVGWEENVGIDTTPTMWGDMIFHQSPYPYTHSLAPRLLKDTCRAIDGLDRRYLMFPWAYGLVLYDLVDEYFNEYVFPVFANGAMDHFERADFWAGGTSGMTAGNALDWMANQMKWPNSRAHISSAWVSEWIDKDDTNKVHTKWEGLAPAMDASWHPGVYSKETDLPYDPQEMNDTLGNLRNCQANW